MEVLETWFVTSLVLKDKCFSQREVNAVYDLYDDRQ